MSDTIVVHCMQEEYDVYIGRGRGNTDIWGSPFTHKKGTMAPVLVDSIEEVLIRYREYVKSKPELLKRLPELKGKRLGCWCKNKRNPDALCHGDVLIDLINEMCND